MTEKKPPHEKMTESNNKLSSAQEVEYADDFKKADNVTNNEKQNPKK